MALKRALIDGVLGIESAADASARKSATRRRIRSSHLLIMTQFFPPDFAATGQLIEELVTQIGQQNVDVRVFTGQPGYAFAKENAPEVETRGRVRVKRSRTTQVFSRRIRGKTINGLLFAVRSLAHLAINSRRYQTLLVTTAPPFLPMIGYLANVFFGLSYVCLLYDLYPDIAVELKVVKGNHPIAVLWRWINCRVWRRSDKIIVLSESMKQRIARQCPAVTDKISVIHSWADSEKIVPIAKKDNWFAREHGLVEPFVVMYSGNMGRCHDIDTIFLVAQRLKNEPILFVCIGDGAKRTALTKAVAAAGLKNFLFLPYQEKSALPYSLTACDLSLVSVADGMESLVAPSKLYPAMATGRPIGAICPSHSYLKYLLATASCGAAFGNGEVDKVADFILGLSRDQEKAKTMGASGRQYLESHFTPKIAAQQYLSALKLFEMRI
ncbi:glycosyltransferase family 4 protein [cf. Phormidesmis sp. LEGE 11477]|uniref:glycosyltransferase family 4 protein n=1 Tax=cf. Phormidesmis sp. LEGE 11477 TaxID=1828680 RepID=UPI0018830637|nr:glycosyltransferase family 4 protein [cf. Phormidesmis sp. LEGE 11477]MBE9061351.1 glycosyltransferase family 4 protein [cf. Phormidesmis sp. LEGE 11477]